MRGLPQPWLVAAVSGVVLLACGLLGARPADAAGSATASGSFAVTATIDVGGSPYGVAVSPDGSRAYVTNGGSDTVSVIDTATSTVTATITVGTSPFGVAVSPDGTHAYVANLGSGTVSVITYTPPPPPPPPPGGGPASSPAT